MLDQVPLRIRYNSAEFNLVREFYIPCLAESTEYSRAAGYFTSHGLSLAAQGVASLIQNDGRMRLIASPNLTSEDIEAIEAGRVDVIGAIAVAAARDLESTTDFIARKRLEALTWMIREGYLDIRIAYKQSPLSDGLYHEKGGVFRDARSNAVAFIGSGNETAGGWVDNFETLSVYCSWKATKDYVDDVVHDFERLWSDNYPGLRCLKFSVEAKSILQPYTPTERPKSDPESNSSVDLSEPSRIGLPVGVELRDYQVCAIRSWFEANGRGVFKMATGSGKTITALAIAANLVSISKTSVIVVVAPYIHLAQQWAEEARRFGFDPIEVLGESSAWSKRVDARVSALSSSKSPLMMIATADSFRGKRFQGYLVQLPRNALLIADEVHNLGASQLSRCLPEKIVYRLGLSATPERHMDDEGTSNLLSYFGKVLEPQFSLRDALERGVLCPYEYHPIRVDLTDEEDAAYAELSLQIARYSGGERDPKGAQEERVKMLRLKRARIVAVAARKLDSLKAAIAPYSESSHILVYCGAGSVTDPLDESTHKQIDMVCGTLGNDMGMRVSRFTYDTELDRRAGLLGSLDNGEIQALVAIKCLDEGVDVPSIRTAFILASTTNPREFIQRRGRLLRKSPGKSHATIYDFLVLPSIRGKSDDLIKGLVCKELKRAYEFAGLAKNAGMACKQIVDWTVQYGVSVHDSVQGADRD